MKKQKIRALAESVNGQNYATAEETIEKWLAENPIDLMVVGLTPSQVRQLAHRLDTVESEYIEGDGYADVIYEFLAEQTFDNEQKFTESAAPSWDTAPQYNGMMLTVVG